MKMRCLFLLAMSSLLMSATLAAPQTPPELPKVIWIFREEGKPARGAQHAEVEQGFARMWAKANVQPFLGMESVSGNPNELMFISGYDSLAGFEKDYQTFGKAAGGPLKAEYDALNRREADLVTNVRSAVAMLRPDLSYHPERFIASLPQARYFNIYTFRVRLGHDADFAAGSKLYMNAFEKIKREQPYVIYQIALGAPEGTYLLFSPMKSLKEADDEFANEKALIDALGEETAKNLMKTTGDVFLTLESNLYAFNPNISHVSKEFAAQDPKFWTPKPMAKRPPAIKKEGAKPAAEGKSQ